MKEALNGQVDRMPHPADVGQQFSLATLVLARWAQGQGVRVEAIPGPSSVSSLTKADLATSCHGMSNLPAKDRC